MFFTLFLQLYQAKKMLQGIQKAGRGDTKLLCIMRGRDNDERTKKKVERCSIVEVQHKYKSLLFG